MHTTRLCFECWVSFVISWGFDHGSSWQFEFALNALPKCQVHTGHPGSTPLWTKPIAQVMRHSALLRPSSTKWDEGCHCGRAGVHATRWCNK